MNSTTTMLGMPPRIDGTVIPGKPVSAGGPGGAEAIGPGRPGGADGDSRVEPEANGEVAADGGGLAESAVGRVVGTADGGGVGRGLADGAIEGAVDGGLVGTMEGATDGPIEGAMDVVGSPEADGRSDAGGSDIEGGSESSGLIDNWAGPASCPGKGARASAGVARPASSAPPRPSVAARTAIVARLVLAGKELLDRSSAFSGRTSGDVRLRRPEPNRPSGFARQWRVVCRLDAKDECLHELLVQLGAGGVLQAIERFARGQGLAVRT